MILKLSGLKLGTVYRSENVCNKRFGCLLYCWSSLLLLSLLLEFVAATLPYSRRRGEEKGRLDDMFCNNGRDWGFLGTVTAWEFIPCLAADP
jgi:hypothetical protein